MQKNVKEVQEGPFSTTFRGTRTRTNTNPNGTEANAAGRSGNARALRKQSKCGMIQEGELAPQPAAPASVTFGFVLS